MTVKVLATNVVILLRRCYYRQLKQTVNGMLISLANP